MDELTRHFHQHIENVTAQVRADHVHQTRLLTEHYIQRIAEIEYERDEIQAAREEEAQQAVDEYEELEEERDDLQTEKEEWEQEKEELEQQARNLATSVARLQMNVHQLEADYEDLDREKDELEEEKQELEEHKERLEEDESMWNDERDDLEKRISELELEKRQLLRKEVALRQHFGESERLRMADQKTGAEQVQRLARDLAREREEFAAYRIKAESQQRKYAAALKEQMDAVQRFAPPPILPVEVLANVAAFVAGANDYSTLSAFSKTSRLMQLELSSIVHETVIWDDSWQKRMKDCKAQGNYPDHWKYIRFIIADQPQWQQHARPVVNAAFPNLRASIVKDLHPAKIYPEYDVPPRFTAELQILKRTSLASLSSVLRHPLEWKFYEHGGFITHTSRVLDIWRVTLASNATLAINRNEQDLFKPSAQDGLRTIQFERADERNMQTAEDRIRSFAAMLHFLKPMDSQRKHRLTIVCRTRDDLEAWKLQLPFLLRMNPHLYPQLQVHLPGAMTPQEFIGHAHSFAHFYQIIPQDALNARDEDRDTAVVLFELLVSTQAIREEQYAATFTRLPGQIGFHGALEEYPMQPEGGDDAVIVLEENQFLPIPPPQVEADIQQRNGNEHDQGDESDGSELTALPTDDEM